VVLFLWPHVLGQKLHNFERVLILSSFLLLSASSAQVKKELEKRNIKRIVSVGHQFREVFKEVEYHIIRLDDDEEEFLLPYIPPAIEFIREGLKDTENSAVLVHW